MQKSLMALHDCIINRDGDGYEDLFLDAHAIITEKIGSRLTKREDATLWFLTQPTHKTPVEHWADVNLFLLSMLLDRGIWRYEMNANTPIDQQPGRIGFNRAEYETMVGMLDQIGYTASDASPHK